jgi:hypothetical protein
MLIFGGPVVNHAASSHRSWQGSGRAGAIDPAWRSNGSVFTVDSLARCLLHELVHHLHDVDA